MDTDRFQGGRDDVRSARYLILNPVFLHELNSEGLRRLNFAPLFKVHSIDDITRHAFRFLPQSPRYSGVIQIAFGIFGGGFSYPRISFGLQ